mmetsp:Transcript_146550/g.470145  ORF Transcript_146550/g.470145 Transcript_146550/m.470145 type:complete len:300 (-) Transcript_146550:338-1237(-)
MRSLLCRTAACARLAENQLVFASACKRLLPSFKPCNVASISARSCTSLARPLSTISRLLRASAIALSMPRSVCSSASRNCATSTRNSWSPTEAAIPGPSQGTAVSGEASRELINSAGAANCVTPRPLRPAAGTAFVFGPPAQPICGEGDEQRCEGERATSCCCRTTALADRPGLAPPPPPGHGAGGEDGRWGLAGRANTGAATAATAAAGGAAAQRGTAADDDDDEGGEAEGERPLEPDLADRSEDADPLRPSSLVGRLPPTTAGAAAEGGGAPAPRTAEKPVRDRLGVRPPRPAESER